MTATYPPLLLPPASRRFHRRPPLGGPLRPRSRSASVCSAASGLPEGLPTVLAGAVRICLASDHAGFRLKGVIGAYLRQAGHTVTDLGTDSEDPVPYPRLCADAARRVVAGEADAGIVMGGSGQGEAIAANKVRGARAALCHDETTARLARQHNDANVLSLGQRVVGDDVALAVVDVFLATPFEGGRHVPRLAELADIEAEEAAGT